ncbi:hypothetical protein C8F01DRAFT_1092051 [Mycena amicta]|nr:hypothetical protein C8F01DRAFT_1092051 [Mycena amicta]
MLNGVDVSTLLATRLAEQDTSGHDDPEIEVLPGRPLPDDDDDDRTAPPAFPPLPQPPSLSRPPTTSLDPATPPSIKTRSRLKKEEKRRQKRAAAAPYVKGVGAQRLREAQKRAIRVETDTGTRPGPDADLAEALDGFDWGQDDLDGALAALGMQYVDWRSGDSIPIYDARRRLLALLTGYPRGDNWSEVIMAANNAVEKAAPRIKLSTEKRAHRRAADEFPALARGTLGANAYFP